MSTVIYVLAGFGVGMVMGGWAYRYGLRDGLKGRKP